MDYKLKILPALVCLTLAACGDDSDDDSPPPMAELVSQWGIIGTDTEEEVEIFARFGQFTGALEMAQLRQELIPTLDECEVSTETASEDDGDDDVDFEFSVAYDDQSAGETIVITSPAGTFTTLSLPESGESMIYSNADAPPPSGPAPDGLVADIPGDQFPAFSNVSVPNVQALDITSPGEGVAVTPESTLSWVSNNTANSYLDISISSEDTATGSIATVECTVADDGEFSFPEQTQLEMGSTFSGSSADYSRTTYRIEQSGTTLLIINNTADI